MRRHAIKEIHRSGKKLTYSPHFFKKLYLLSRACIQSLFDESSGCHGNGVCTKPPEKSISLRPPQNLLLQQLSQVEKY